MGKNGNQHGIAFAIFLVLLGSASGRPPDAPWVFDVVHLSSGTIFRGLILEENSTNISFLCIRRQPGRATVFLPTVFSPREIARVERLNKSEREQLQRRVAILRGETETRESRLRQLELRPIDWFDRPAAGQEYRSDWFALQSDAPEEIVRRAALRLEEVFAAFGRFLPARQVESSPIIIRLLRSRDEYRTLLRSENRSFENTAFYDPAGRRVVCATDLERLGHDLHRVRQQHQQMRGELDRHEAALTRLYKGSELLRHIQPIRDTRSRIDQADRQNETVFAQTTRNLFATLTHEAFHAYVDSAAELPVGAELPRWLNEGLAQVFESAIVEGGELRLGHADTQRLSRIKDMVRKKSLTPLESILKSRADQFLADHGSAYAGADQHYLAAWGLAMYLTFERRLVGSQQFAEYLKALANRQEPVSAFATWIAGDVAEFERDWHQYLIRLQPDGTLAAFDGGK